MITYNDIYEALRKERYSEQLQPLAKNFISEVAEYLEDKKKVSEKEDNVFSDAIMKTKKQLENAISIFRELMLRRKKKIMALAFIAAETGISKKDFENMLNFEKELFDSIVKAIEKEGKEISSFLNGGKEKKSQNKLIVFKEEVEEFLGLDGGKLGPFKKGEIANLPEEISRILIDGKKADGVEE